MTWFVYVFIVGALLPGSLQDIGALIGPCVWQFDDGGVVDFNSLGNTDGTPRWANRISTDPEQDSHVYSINPCHPFNQGANCTDVTACRTGDNGKETTIGKPDTENIYYDSAKRNLVIEYSSDNMRYVTRIVTGCIEEDEDQLVVDGLLDPGIAVDTFQFILLSRCACVDVCATLTFAPPTGVPHVSLVTGQTAPKSMSPHTVRPVTTHKITAHTVRPVTTHKITAHTVRPVTKVTPHTLRPTPPPKGLSAGGVICIVFVCLVCAYFILGALYMFIFRGARGVEIIPNVGFWRDLPVLILDGVSFIFSGCQPTVQMKSSSPDYDKI